MSETEKLLNFYKEFYYELWGSDWVSSDKLYEYRKLVEGRLGYSNDDIDESDVEEELKEIK